MTRDEEVKYAIAEFFQTMEDTLNAVMRAVDARARAEEREACAKVCDEWCESADDHEAGAALNIRAAIRARGEKP